ncbi:MAG: OsmC family protein [Anaerolineae bacterium]|nr:OsmC family protein [Anaerolineae bacterium]MDW8067294.1 OsmC family protein [Anaerolineae bacterium]
MHVQAQYLDGLRSVVTVGVHAVVVDPAPEEGGAGTGMSAPQLLVAALAACILAFIARSCQLHDIPLKHLKVELDFTIASAPRRIGRIVAHVRMEPEPPEEVRRRLLAVARRATLLNTLACPPEITLQFE